MPYKIFIVCNSGNLDGRALTSQVIEYDNPEDADTAYSLLMEHKNTHGFNILIVKLY